MPTECERNSTSLAAQKATTTQQQLELELAAYQRTFDMSDPAAAAAVAAAEQSSHTMSKSQTSIDSPTADTTTNGLKGSTNGGDSKKTTPLISPDPTSYVTKARVTRPTPPPPSCNPMQFVQIKPCNLYQTAQEQLKKAEEVKKIKEIKKEEPEDWQNNLDNWKSSRRKRVEHIIDRVVEVKKLELEEHDRSRRKSKTFSEMIEERGERAGGRGRTKLTSLAVYNEDESNDLSDLGIGTSSASGKSSLSEDYDNNSVTSDNAELDKAIHNESNHKSNAQTMREYISSPGYETSSSTAPASSPDPCEYTYEGAIQDYKQRISRATSNGGGFKVGSSHNNNNNHGVNVNGTGEQIRGVPPSKPPPTTLNLNQTTKPDRDAALNTEQYSARRGHKIEDRLLSFEITSPSAQESQDGAEKSKVDVPKIDISKRKEIFESQSSNSNGNGNAPTESVAAPRVNLRDRFKFEAAASTDEPPQKKDVKRLSGDLTSIRQRLQNLEQQKDQKEQTTGMTSRSVDIPVPPLKDRLFCLQNAANKEEVKKPKVALVDARQLEIMRKEEETAQQRMQQQSADQKQTVENGSTGAGSDLNDSGIHTTDDAEGPSGDQLQRQQEQEAQLNAAIAALAIEEKQLEQAANAVNQIEAEFDELTTNAVAATVSGNSTNPTQLPYEMDFSINEALELALEAIDKEHKLNINNAVVDDKKQIKIETTIQINQTTITTEEERNNKNDDDVDKAEKTTMRDVHQQQKPGGQEALNYVPQETQVEIKLEPIYENIAAPPTAAPTASSSDSAIIPNMNSHERKSCIDNNNDNNKQQLQQQQQQNSTHHQNKNQNQSHHHQHHQHHHHHQQRNHKQSQINNAINQQQTNQNNCENNENNKNISNAFANTTTIETTMLNVKTSTELLIADQKMQHQQQPKLEPQDPEPYYQVPKSSEPYYDAPKHLRPVPVYENIEVFYNGFENINATTTTLNGFSLLEPPKEKPPPPPAESPPPMHDNGGDNTDTWSSSENTYETISSRHHSSASKTASALIGDHPSPPIKRVNSTKRIKKELRNKRSSFLGIDPSALDDEEHYLEMTVAPPPDMAQFLQQERQLEKQLYMKTTALCDSSDTGESRDSGVSENHSRQSSEHYTNSSEENERHIDVDVADGVDDVSLYRDENTSNAPTPLLQTVKGDSAESWTESATAAAAASQSLTEATATANAKINSIEEKIREQEEVLRVERELLQLEQEELKRQRENLMLRENMARRELQHGAKMLMSANRRSLQELNGGAMSTIPAPLAALSQLPLQQQHPQPLPQQQQQIYANIPNLQQQYYQMDIDYRKSMSDLNEFSAAAKRNSLPPVPPTKPMRAMHLSATTNNSPTIANGHHFHHQQQLQNQQEYLVMTANQRFGGSLVKIAAPAPTAAPRSHIYSNFQHRSQQNLSSTANAAAAAHPQHGNMTRNTLHALSATPKPKYTDGWVQQQQQQFQNRKSIDAINQFANDPAWLSAYHQKRKSMPSETASHAYGSAAYNTNHWLVQEAEQRRLSEEQRRSLSTGNTPLHQQKLSAAASKPLPDAIIQTLTERVQSKGIGERKRLDNYKTPERSPLHAASAYHHNHLLQPPPQPQQQQPPHTRDSYTQSTTQPTPPSATSSTNQDKVLSVSGKKKCSHCGDELGRGAAMIIESLLLFYHINCFKCCVCHVQLGDGLNGTDVRVRNHKLHCQNCYSSDDGVKFSCV